MSIGVQKQPILVEVLAPTRLALRGSHVQRQYRKWTTLCSKSSTIKGLLYARWRSRYKEFIARKARTISLSKARGSCHKTSNNQPIHECGYPFGDSIPGLYCVAWLRPRSRKKVSVQGFLWERKVWIVFSPTDVHCRNLQQKVEKGKFTGSEATTRFPQASCFEKPTCSVQETRGHMYDVLAWSANGTRNRTRNWIPVQPRKARRN
jgi:hypothetical protein